MKIAAILLLTCLVCTTHVSAKFNLGKILSIVLPTSAINDAIVQMLENMRINFPCGFPDHNIPVLEPLEVEEYSFTIDGGLASNIAMNMRDIQVHGLQGFVTKSVDFDLINHNFHFDFNFPAVRLAGMHRTIARIAGVIPVPISGDGPFTIDLVNVRAVGVAHLSIRDGHLHMDDIVVGATIESAVSNVTGFGVFGNIINSQISEAIPEIAAQEQEGVNNVIREMMLGPANEALNQMTLGDLIDLITDTAEAGSPEKRC